MVKSKSYNKRIHNIVIFSRNSHVLSSICSIEKINRSFKVQSIKFEEHTMSKKNIYVVDDSVSFFLDIIKLYEDNISGRIFLLSKRTNLDFNNFKKLKVFYKPFRLFSLYKEIEKRAKNRSSLFINWNLEKNKIILKKENIEVPLTEKEYDLMKFLTNNFDTVSENHILLKKIWNINIVENILETRVLESLVYRLRKKFSNYENGPVIEKVREGYRIKI